MTRSPARATYKMKPVLSLVLMISLILSVVTRAAPVIGVDSIWQKQQADFQESQYQSIERGIKDGPRHEPGKGSFILDERALILTTDKDPVDVQLRRTRALLAHLKTTLRVTNLTPLEAEITKIAAEAELTRTSSQGGKLHTVLEQVSVERLLYQRSLTVL